jgi:hypothetical protein
MMTSETLLAAPVSCLGHALDISDGAFGMMRRSDDIADDAEALRDRIVEDGYLYLPGLLERAEVMGVRESVTGYLEANGYLDPAHPAMDGVVLPDKSAVNLDGIVRARELTAHNPRLLKLLYEGALPAFFERFLGGPVRHFDYTWFRTKAKGAGTPPHCDIVYMSRGTRNLFTSWVPIGDVPLELGGLILLENSHRQSDRIRNYLERDVDVYCVNRPGADEIASGKKKHWDGRLATDAASLRKHLGRRWLTAEYRAGDVVIFGMEMVHAGLDNHTNRLRLSSDCRFQLAAEPVDGRWISVDGRPPTAHGPDSKRGMIC